MQNYRCKSNNLCLLNVCILNLDDLWSSLIWVHDFGQKGQAFFVIDFFTSSATHSLRSLRSRGNMGCSLYELFMTQYIYNSINYYKTIYIYIIYTNFIFQMFNEINALHCFKFQQTFTELLACVLNGRLETACFKSLERPLQCYKLRLRLWWKHRKRTDFEQSQLSQNQHGQTNRNVDKGDTNPFHQAQQASTKSFLRVDCYT